MERTVLLLGRGAWIGAHLGYPDRGTSAGWSEMTGRSPKRSSTIARLHSAVVARLGGAPAMAAARRAVQRREERRSGAPSQTGSVGIRGHHLRPGGVSYARRVAWDGDEGGGRGLADRRYSRMALRSRSFGRPDYRPARWRNGAAVRPRGQAASLRMGIHPDR